MKVLARSLLTTLAICGASQAQQTPAQNPGTPGTQNPGQTTGNQSGRPGSSTGQPGQQAGQNPAQPGRTPIGQNPAQQPGQGAGINPIGPIGQPGQNPIGQPGQNQIGQQGKNPIGQPGAMANGQRNMGGRNVGINGQPSQAQFEGALYQSPDIRRSLNLTSEQMDRLNAANTQIQQRYTNELSRLSSLSPAQREVEAQRLRTSQMNDFYRSSNSLLTSEQLRRYQQLDYQYRGPAAFTDPAVRTRLNVTEDQARQFQLMQQNALNAQSFLRNSDGTPRNNGMAEYNAYRSRTSERMDAILSQEQRDRWRGMIGEPYNFGPYVSSIYVR